MVLLSCCIIMATAESYTKGTVDCDFEEVSRCGYVQPNDVSDLKWTSTTERNGNR